jgi:sphingomyelin phosphodiesterase 2
MAVLFFSGELNALREFEWEVRNARGRAVLQLGGGGEGGIVGDGRDVVGDGAVEEGGW